MKKQLLTLTFSFFLFTNLIAQEWAPIGATWHLSVRYYTTTDIHYSRLESIGDTIFENQPCRIITRSNATCLGRPTVEFMYNENNKVYYYDFQDSIFNLLIDFNAEVGETWEVPMWTTGGQLVFPIRVDSISYLQHQDDSLRIQHVSLSYDDNIFIDLGQTVIEDIGFSDGLFIDLSAQIPCDIDYEGPLRCYEDENLGLISFVDYACDLVPTEEIENQFTQVEIYPNPSSDFIFIDHQFSDADNLSYSIFSIDGKSLGSSKLVADKIDVSLFSKGIYFLQIFENENLISIKKIIRL
ncbi:MAG: T9SS type A sorting domain-containing protein [Saprospiraceae bacterium]